MTLPCRKLSSPYDDDMRTDFKNMIRIYPDNTQALQDAIDSKTVVDFWATDLAPFKDYLVKKKQPFYPTWNDPPNSLRVISIKLTAQPKPKGQKKQWQQKRIKLQKSCVLFRELKKTRDDKMN